MLDLVLQSANYHSDGNSEEIVNLPVQASFRDELSSHCSCSALLVLQESHHLLLLVELHCQSNCAHFLAILQDQELDYLQVDHYYRLHRTWQCSEKAVL
jgi:hypothetical protein